MKMKTKKKREKKHNTENDRINAIRKSKVKSNQKCNPVKFKIIPLYGKFNDRYRSGLFNYLITKNFHSMITLTHNHKISLIRHEAIINRILKLISSKGYICCYFKVNELDNGNYHSHILVEDAGVVKSLTGIFKRNWKDYGFVDLKRIVSDSDKCKAVDYCLKQLKPEDRRHVIQELIDTWDYFQISTPKIEVNLFRNEAFLASIMKERDYHYKRPAGSLLIAEMTSEEAFCRIQAKMDNLKVPQKNLVAIYK